MSIHLCNHTQNVSLGGSLNKQTHRSDDKSLKVLTLVLLCVNQASYGKPNCLRSQSQKPVIFERSLSTVRPGQAITVRESCVGDVDCVPKLQ